MRRGAIPSASSPRPRWPEVGSAEHLRRGAADTTRRAPLTIHATQKTGAGRNRLPLIDPPSPSVGVSSCA